MVLGHSPLRCLAADGAILVHERKASSKEARNRRRSVPRGLVSFPWQPSQCLIKLSPCPPPCSSASTFLSLQLSPAIPLVHPRSDETTEEGLGERGNKAVGHFLFVSNNLWDLHAPMLVTFMHYDSSRVATEHLIHYSKG